MREAVILGATMMFGAAAVYSSAALNTSQFCSTRVEPLFVTIPEPRPIAPIPVLSWPVEERFRDAPPAQSETSTAENVSASGDDEQDPPRRHHHHGRRWRRW